MQVVVTQVPRFISRYNELATMMNDADEASWEAHSGVEIEDDTDAADEPPSDARAAGAGKEQAEEGSEAGVDEDDGAEEAEEVIPALLHRLIPHLSFQKTASREKSATLFLN